MHRFLISRFTIFGKLPVAPAAKHAIVTHIHAATVLTLTFTVIALDANFWVFWATFTDDTFINRGFEIVAETDGQPWAWMPLDFAVGILTLLFLVPM